MKRKIQKIYRLFTLMGIDPLVLFRFISGMPMYLRDMSKLRKQRKTANSSFHFSFPWPCINDKFNESGITDPHYFFQDLYVAGKIYNNTPLLHVDVGSRIDGFVSHVASFREITVMDIRPLSRDLDNISFIQADIMSTLDTKFFSYCDSLSCLHALEHFGLGRYGDPINYNGHIEGLNNLYSLLKPGGKLYLSVPIGPQRIEFNAHRVFSVYYLLQIFKDKFDIECFSYIDDRGTLHKNTALTDDCNDNFGCYYGCGIFEMKKK